MSEEDESEEPEELEDEELEEEEDEGPSTLNRAFQAATTFLGAAVIITAVVLIGTLAMIFNGFVIQTLWGWFLVPLGLMELGLAHAVGLGLVVRYLTWQQPTKNEREESSNEEIKRRLIVGVMYPMLVLGLGWVVHMFMV